MDSKKDKKYVLSLIVLLIIALILIYILFCTVADSSKKTLNTVNYNINLTDDQKVENISSNIVEDDINNNSKKYSENDKDEISLVQFDSKFYKLEDISIDYRICSNIKNYKDFEFDLDGDNQIDTITILHQLDDTDDEFQENNYLIKLNGEVFFENFENKNTCAVYIADLNETDNSIEVIIYDDGPSDDPSFKIYTKQDSKMILLDELEGYPLYTNKNGDIVCLPSRMAMTNPIIFNKYYKLEDSNLNSIDLKLSDITGMTFSAKNYLFTEDLNNIEKYFQLNESKYDNEIDSEKKYNDAGIIRLTENDTFSIISISNDLDIEVELNTGKKGYILSNHFSD